MADTKTSALTPVTALGLADIFPVLQGGANKSATPAKIRDLLGGTAHAGYAVGRNYNRSPGIVRATGGAAGNTLIKFIPVVITQTTTVDALISRITTVGTTTGCMAIYASDQATKYPTGNPLQTTAQIANTSLGGFTASLGASLQLAPGLYWIAVMWNDAAVICVACSTSAGDMGWLIGSTGTVNIINSTNQLNYLSTPIGVYGTWPDMTSVTPSEGTGVGFADVVLHMVSVP